MKLKDYLDRRGETQAAFAERAARISGADISQRTISRVCGGDGCTAATALAIIRATHDEPTPGGGTVALEDLVTDGAEAAA